MFRKLKFLLTVVTIILLGGAFSIWWYQSIRPVSADKNVKRFVIIRGSGASQIGNKLHSEGLIRDPLAFKLYVQLSGNQKKIQAGEYDLSPSYSLIEVVQELVKGPREVWVTIPEGLRREELGQKFASSFGLSGEKAREFRTEFLALTKEKEGYLFPDTYLFPRTASPSTVVTRLTSVFDERFAIIGNTANTKLTTYQTLIVASLLERETITEGEKPIVAGIIMNRLNGGWPLQIDAAVQYAVASEKCDPLAESCEWWPKLTKKDDIAVDSPYNTYKYPGLPPGPIASPGLSSIKAVLNAEETDYWYYLHDSKGQIHYAKTLDEHNENIRKYLNK